MSSRVIAQTNYDFTFTSETGSGQSVSGIFTVTGSTITGISGNVTGGGPGVIGKLKSAREHVADNVFSPTDPYLNASGVGFTTSPTSYFALFYDNASVYQLNGYYTSGGTLVSTTVSYGAMTVTLDAGGAPEIDGSLAPKVGFLLGCLFLMFGRKKQDAEPMMTA